MCFIKGLCLGKERDIYMAEHSDIILEERGKVKDSTHQSGRSLTEMLATLAIMGVLTIGAIAGFSYAMNRQRANQIIHDARVGYYDEYGAENPHTDWFRIKPLETDRPMSVKRDKLGRIYVRVNAVGKDVCWHVLRMAAENILSFYNTDNTEMTSCPGEENTIVIAFNGVSAPAECADRGDCGEGFEGICQDNGQCHACDTELEEWIPDAKICQCLSDTAKQCQNKEGISWCCNTASACGAKAYVCDQKCAAKTAVFCEKGGEEWCCDSGMMCGREVGQCSDGTCSARYVQDEEANDSLCSIFYQQREDANDDLCFIKYEQDSTNVRLCQMTLTVADGVSSYSEDDTCRNANMYCLIDYTNAARTVSVTATSTGTLYGTCSPLNEHDGSMGYTFSEPNPCTGDRYCLVDYTNAARTTSVTATSTGTLYGTCSPLSAHDGSMGYEFSEPNPCTGDRYCLVDYTNAARTKSVTATSTGELFGTCSPLGEHDGSMGYAFSEETICPEDYYCSLQWRSNLSCSASIAATTIGDLYGVCVPLTEKTGVCPYK